MDLSQQINAKLINAAIARKLNILENLIDQGADVNAMNNKEDTNVLLRASVGTRSGGDPEIVRFLLECGADPDCEMQGYTALDYINGLVWEYNRCVNFGKLLEIAELLSQASSNKQEFFGKIISEKKIDEIPLFVNRFNAGSYKKIGWIIEGIISNKLNEGDISDKQLNEIRLAIMDKRVEAGRLEESSQKGIAL